MKTTVEQNKRLVLEAIEDGLLVEPWDVIQDEATEAQSKSKAPMFGTRFPR
jgi:hypothetical protein